MQDVFMEILMIRVLTTFEHFEVEWNLDIGWVTLHVQPLYTVTCCSSLIGRGDIDPSGFGDFTTG